MDGDDPVTTCYFCGKKLPVDHQDIEYGTVKADGKLFHESCIVLGKIHDITSKAPRKDIFTLSFASSLYDIVLNVMAAVDGFKRPVA
jgi:hypothetical protein